MTDKELIAEARTMVGNWRFGPGGIRDILERVADALEARQWRTIDSAPKDGTPIIIYLPDERSLSGYGVYKGEWRAKNGFWDVGDGMVQSNQVSHWQPLPAPPEE